MTSSYDFIQDSALSEEVVSYGNNENFLIHYQNDVIYFTKIHTTDYYYYHYLITTTKQSILANITALEPELGVRTNL